VLGFPIRTPWDHSSVDSSPRPIAASHVLHRLLVPRHPPCALSNLTTNHTTTPPQPAQASQSNGRSQAITKKMLASTVQFSTNTQPPPHHRNTLTQPGCSYTDRQQSSPKTQTPPTPENPGKPVHVCFFRTQQGVHRHHQPHPADRSLPTPHPPQKGETGPGPTRPTKPLSVMTRQCLRHRAPPPHIRERRAPHPFSREGAP
jgi:hypothetical protein